MASCTAEEAISVDSREGELRVVAPKSVCYSAEWCGAADADSYVVIEVVAHAGMFNEEVISATTNRTASGAEYADGEFSFGESGDVRCVRLVHRVYDVDGAELGEPLARDVSFGVVSVSSPAVSVDSRTNSLQAAVDSCGAFDLTYDTDWGTNVASLALSAVKVEGAVETTNVLLEAEAPSVGVKRLAGVPSGLWRLYCTFYGGNGEVTGTPLEAGYYRKPAFLMIVR